MSASVEVVDIADAARWRELAASSSLPSHAWDYAHALVAAGQVPRLACVTTPGARMLVPFVERAWRGYRDVATYIVTAGAWLDAPSPAPFAAWAEFAAAQGWASGYLQLATDVGLDAAQLPGEVTTINEWYVRELDEALSPASFAVSVRQKIAHAARAGVAIIEGVDALETDFLRLYPLTLARVGAAAHYHLPDEALRRWLRAPQALVLGAAVDGRPEAVSIFLVGPRDAEYHLAASSERGRDFAAPLLWEAMHRLRARGVLRLHLGGGVRRDDGLAQFKQRFQPEARPLRALRQVYDPAAFADACRDAGVPEQGGAYFPPYRAVPA